MTKGLHHVLLFLFFFYMYDSLFLFCVSKVYAIVCAGKRRFEERECFGLVSSEQMWPRQRVVFCVCVSLSVVFRFSTSKLINLSTISPIYH